MKKKQEIKIPSQTPTVICASPSCGAVIKLPFPAHAINPHENWFWMCSSCLKSEVVRPSVPDKIRKKAME
jgi:hypothetical protein